MKMPVATAAKPINDKRNVSQNVRLYRYLRKPPRAGEM